MILKQRDHRYTYAFGTQTRLIPAVYTECKVGHLAIIIQCIMLNN